MYCDFHTHFSVDGYAVPEEVMPLMAKLNCKGFATLRKVYCFLSLVLFKTERSSVAVQPE